MLLLATHGFVTILVHATGSFIKFNISFVDHDLMVECAADPRNGPCASSLLQAEGEQGLLSNIYKHDCSKYVTI